MRICICAQIYVLMHVNMYLLTHVHDYILSLVTFACYQQFRIQIVLTCESGSHVPNLLSSKQTYYIVIFIVMRLFCKFSSSLYLNFFLVHVFFFSI